MAETPSKKMDSSHPTEEELRRMSPQERIKALKALEDQRRKELEEARKKAEEEIAVAEELIKETEEEVAVESERSSKEETHEKSSRKNEDDLEGRVEREKISRAISEQQEQLAKQYALSGAYERRPDRNDLYSTLGTATQTLENLYLATDWGTREAELYRQAKDTLDRARSYNLSSEKLREEFGTADSVLKRLQYRH